MPARASTPIGSGLYHYRSSDMQMVVYCFSSESLPKPLKMHILQKALGRGRLRRTDLDAVQLARDRRTSSRLESSF